MKGMYKKINCWSLLQKLTHLLRLSLVITLTISIIIPINHSFAEKFDKNECISKIPKNASSVIANKMKMDCKRKEISISMDESVRKNTLTAKSTIQESPPNPTKEPKPNEKTMTLLPTTIQDEHLSTKEPKPNEKTMTTYSITVFPTLKKIYEADPRTETSVDVIVGGYDGSMLQLTVEGKFKHYPKTTQMYFQRWANHDGWARFLIKNDIFFEDREYTFIVTDGKSYATIKAIPLIDNTKNPDWQHYISKKN